MNRPDAVDRQLTGWLTEGPNVLPDHTLEAIVQSIQETDQRRSAWLPRRETMNRGILSVAGVAAMVVVMAVAIGVYFRQTGGVASSPNPAPTATAVPSAAPSAAPSARPTSTASATSTATPAAPSVAPSTVVQATPALVRAGVLRPGTYVTDDFVIPFQFTIEDQGWGLQWETPHLLNIGMSRYSSEFQFYAVYEVHDPETGAIVPAPASLVDWLESVPNLEIASREDVEVGGVPGVRLELRPSGTEEIPLIPQPDPDAPDSQPYGIGINPGDPPEGAVPISHYIFDDIAGGPLVITYYTEDRAFLDALEKVLATVEFRSP